MPAYDFSKPESVAAFLLTLPTLARKGKRSNRVMWFERITGKDADFAKAVKEKLQELKG